MTQAGISDEKNRFIKSLYVNLLLILVAFLFPMSKEFFIIWFGGTILADYLVYKKVDTSSYSKIKEWVDFKIASLIHR